VKLYNTLTRSINEFHPTGDEVKLYVCGITPYDTTHLGHAFTYTSVDILVRYLEFKGFKVCYVQNVTDIDDDILRKANEVGENWRALGNYWISHFIQDMKRLNVRPIDYYPFATDTIPQIIVMVEQLLQAGVAYEAGGNVYFQVERWDAFGKLSRLPYQEMLSLANERGNNPEDPHKHDPLDFVLWQEQAPGEPAWESPWGPGRPGWHIECSAMATHYLGSVIDIHAGGQDLCFPHHEAEISQVESISRDNPFVRFWMHIAMVYHDGEKMSKSLGNLIMIRELLNTYSPDAIRLYLGGHHYRKSWSYNEEELVEYQKLAEEACQAVTVRTGKRTRLDANVAQDLFISAMEEDLNTEKAIKVFNKLVKDVIKVSSTGGDVKEAQQVLNKMAGVFGLQLNNGEPEPRVANGWNEHLKRFVEEDQISLGNKSSKNGV
jgi:L-cysteine:1D-myo-inositol 2-amino-2-deoxy-alpha-D-glucopyranoside ligase